MPGMRTSFRILNERTAMLPDAVDGEVPPIIGINTNSAIRAGVLWTLGKGIDGIIDEIEVRYRTTVRVVVTGGDAGFLILHENRKRIDDPELVLKGAAVYAERQRGD